MAAMTMRLIAVLAIAFAAALPAQAAEVSAEAKASVEKALAEKGCTMAEGEKVEADEVLGYSAVAECDGIEYLMIFDDEFKVIYEQWIGF